MTHNVSRRATVFGLGVAAAGLAAHPSVAAVPTQGTQMTVDGIVAWCHPQRGLLSIKSVLPDSMVVRLKVDASDQPRLKAVRPAMSVTVRLAWRPDLDILSPWVPQDVTCANGEHFVASLAFDDQ